VSQADWWESQNGGSGTTHRAILAGVPNTAVPISFDQPQMTVTPAIVARANQLSAVLSAECGPAAAAGTIATALTRQRG
jgi:trimethylamine:corrinoid methyltransferase-like protein